MKVKVAQSCPTLCDPMDYTVCGILWASILERVAFPFSRGSSWPRDRTQVSHLAGGIFTSWATRKAPYKGRREQIILENFFFFFFTTVGKKKSSKCLLFLSQKEAKTIRPMAWYRVMWKFLSCVGLFAIPWTVAHQAPLSMEFSRQEYWSGLPCSSPGIFLTQGSNPGLLQCRKILYCLS